MKTILSTFLSLQYLSVQSFIQTDIDCKLAAQDSQAALRYCLNQEDNYYNLRSFDNDFVCW